MYFLTPACTCDKQRHEPAEHFARTCQSFSNSVAVVLGIGSGISHRHYPASTSASSVQVSSTFSGMTNHLSIR
jgi:hypothetical protein